MRIRVIALNTFIGLLRNKIMILLFAGFLCVVLLMMSPLMAIKALSATQSARGGQAMVMSLVGAIMTLVSGFGSLLAAWAAADAVAEEMRSGTILAVMARPVRRWEFLLGKYLGVQMLLGTYVLFMFALSYVLAALGGERIQAEPWIPIVYPLVRYALYSAIAMCLVTMMHPAFAFALVMVVAVLSSMVTPANAVGVLPQVVRTPLYAVLPSTELLTETNFLTITQASLKQIAWTDHFVVVAYGLDYALVVFLLACWSFCRRSLSPR
jgi:ABC-type transport system involved in multi-copper enzyme maturation permease subunit